LAAETFVASAAAAEEEEAARSAAGPTVVVVAASRPSVPSTAAAADSRRRASAALLPAAKISVDRRRIMGENRTRRCRERRYPGRLSSSTTTVEGLRERRISAALAGCASWTS
jgi:hypothetical protein